MFLKRVSNFAWPWHGYAKGHNLHLPNGATRETPEPEDGDTLYQRLPWAPGAALTPEQTAADAAVGMQRLDYFLLSTRDHRVYGRIDLGSMGWVYAAPNGTAWAVRLNGINVFDSSWNGEVEAARIGGIGKPSAIHLAPLVLADTGQSHPSLPSELLGSYGALDPGYTIPAAPAFKICDISPDGRRAILMATRGGVNFREFLTSIKYIPVGFWLIELDGTPGSDFVANAQVLYTRAQTLGFVSDTGRLPELAQREWSASNATLASVSGVPAHEQRVTLTAVPADPTRESTIPRGGQGFFFGGEIGAGQHHRSIAVTNQILAVWFDPETGVPTPVYADTRLEWSDERPEPTQTASGTSSGDFHSAGGFINRSGLLTWTFSYTITLQREYRIMLKYKDQALEEFIREEREYSFDGEYSGEIYDSHYAPQRAGVYVSIVSEVEAASKKVTHSGGTFTESIPFYPLPRRQDTRYPGDLSATRHMYHVEQPEFFSGSGSSNTSQYEIGVLRYSNNLLCLLTRHGPPAAWDTWIAGPYMTPRGIGGTVIETPGNHSSGTWHPVTEQVIRGESEPVCWT